MKKILQKIFDFITNTISFTIYLFIGILIFWYLFFTLLNTL
jgi:hypothetical protein